MFQLRCRKCDGCLRQRSASVIAKGLDRISRLEYKVDKIYHFVIGTNWKMHTLNCLSTNYYDPMGKFDFERYSLWDTKWCDWNCGYYVFKEAWYLLRQKINNFNRKAGPLKWDICYRVVERGMKSGYMHLHLLSFNEFDIYRLKSWWSKITGIEKPYVSVIPDNCSKHRYRDWKKRINIVRRCESCYYYSREPVRSFAYLAKYLSKGYGRYYWLGNLLKVGSMPYETVKGCKYCHIEIPKDSYTVGSYELISDIYGHSGQEELNYAFERLEGQDLK